MGDVALWVAVRNPLVVAIVSIARTAALCLLSPSSSDARRRR
jgi:hypothetical protein